MTDDGATAAVAQELSAADAEIEEMQRKVCEMEEEAEKLKKLTDSVEEDVGEGVDREEVDRRSAYIGNVDYGATPEELQEHFKSCGQMWVCLWASYGSVLFWAGRGAPGLARSPKRVS